MSAWDVKMNDGWSHTQPCSCSKCRPERTPKTNATDMYLKTTPKTPTETLKFNVEFDVRDMLRDPEMKKVLQEREQRYLENIAWLDGDLTRRIQDAHSRYTREQELQRVYEENLAWLDNDLNEKLDQRHQENIAWLDNDLDEKLDQRHQENIAWLDSDLEKKVKEQDAWVTLAGIFNSCEEVKTSSSHIADNESQRTPKIWHCGNGTLRGGPQQTLMNYGRGLEMGTYWICHGNEDDEWTKSPGNNASKQFKKFVSSAKEGDIMFLHSSMRKVAGITHWGVFTGEITPVPRLLKLGGISYIHVYEWKPLPETLKGTGLRPTLYEVKPTFKNYQNYSIPS
jgi:hypothetical protein